MFKKRYSSPSKLKVKVTVEGKHQHIVFAGYNPTNKTRNFETSDVLVQEALENTKAFNWLFIIEQEWAVEGTEPDIKDIPEVEEPKEEVIEGLKVHTVETHGAAKKWLYGLGVKVTNHTTKVMAVEEAAKLGFELKFGNTKS